MLIYWFFTPFSLCVKGSFFVLCPSSLWTSERTLKGNTFDTKRREECTEKRNVSKEGGGVFSKVKIVPKRSPVHLSLHFFLLLLLLRSLSFSSLSFHPFHIAFPFLSIVLLFSPSFDVYVTQITTRVKQKESQNLFITRERENRREKIVEIVWEEERVEEIQRHLSLEKGRMELRRDLFLKYYFLIVLITCNVQVMEQKH